jgi:STE24 endopeptidase
MPARPISILSLAALLAVLLLCPAWAVAAPVPVPEPTEQAMAWYRFGNLRFVIYTLLGLLIPGAILVTGASARLRDWTRKLARKPALALLSFLAAYALIVFVVELPFAIWASYMQPHAFGLSEQSFGKWFGDQLKNLMLGILALWLFVPGTLWFVRKSPERWWIWASLAAVPIAFTIVLITPVFIDPLFNDFGPMKDPALEAEILALAERAGIEGSRVFEVDKSVDTNTVNAYVTGLGATKRIVLWDTIIAKLDRDALLVVMGHEMGHYVLGHVVNSMILLALGIPLSLWAFHVVARRLIARHRARFGFDSIADVAALPLFALLISAFAFLITPVANLWSRHQEHESDRFALELTHDNEACARAFVELARSNLGNPRPGMLFVIWRASHPTLGDRIDFCNEYRPWETGEPQVHAHLFAD